MKFQSEFKQKDTVVFQKRDFSSLEPANFTKIGIKHSWVEGIHIQIVQLMAKTLSKWRFIS